MSSTIRLGLLMTCFFLVFSAPAGGQSQTYANTRSPHGPLNIPCQNCHTLSGWKPIRNAPEFDHNQTRFPLRGMHQAVTCTQCHVKPVFTNVGSKCADCHADIHKRQFGASCEQCHSVKGWQVSAQQIKSGVEPAKMPVVFQARLAARNIPRRWGFGRLYLPWASSLDTVQLFVCPAGNHSRCGGDDDGWFLLRTNE